MNEFLLDEHEILERIDEYSILCKYLEFEPELYSKYKSPLREDDENPSFGIFRATRIKNREFGWKDQGSGLSGDVFRLVCVLYGCNREQACRRIASDFKIGPEVPDQPRVITAHTNERREPTKLLVAGGKLNDADFKFWRKFNISRGILEFYRTQRCRYYFSHDSQSSAKFPPGGTGYWYRIGGRSQLYFPFTNDRDKRFRNDLRPTDIMGFEQLNGSDTIIITKSMKDVMCLRSFGYDAISPQGESVLLTEEVLLSLESRYRNRYTFFDNDGKHKADEYPYPQLFVPQETGQKDISDYCDHFGPDATRAFLQQLIPH